MLPPAAYPALFERAAHLPAALAEPAPRLPAQQWVLAHVAPLQLAGAALFLAGNVLQWHSHWLLARLAGGGRARAPGGYKIPRGAWRGGRQGRRGELRLHSLAGLPLCRPSGAHVSPRPGHPSTGGAFELVSCPHYLGEVVIYAGLVGASGGRLPAPWLMLLWVGTNLALAARMTHAWYHQRFKTYPRRRAALIPLLY